MMTRMDMSVIPTIPAVPAVPVIPVTAPTAAVPAKPAKPATTRSSSLDSDSLSGSLSDSGFASSSSTPPTVDTAATSDADDEQHVAHQPSKMQSHQPSSCSASSSPSTLPNPNPKPYLFCTSSLLRTTLLSFAHLRRTPSTTSPASSSSRRSSISVPPSTRSPIDTLNPPTLHAKSTTELCTISNPSLAQFSPIPRASSSLAMYTPHITTSSTSRRYGPRSRSASLRQHPHTAHSGTTFRPRSLLFQTDDRTSPSTHTVTSPFTFWRNPSAPCTVGANSSNVLPSISRAHVPDLVLPTHPSSNLPSASSSSDGFLKIDGSRDGLSFRTAENPSRPNLIVGTPRPSYPISLGAEHHDDDDEVAGVVVVDSPVGDDDDEQPNRNASEYKGKGKERAMIPGRQRQLRVKIILPPTPVRASTTPLPKRTKMTQPTPIPPTLTAIEKSSRLMRDRVHCATCAAAGVDFPRCPRCSEAWCSRECRVARMDELPDGRRKHVCKM